MKQTLLITAALLCSLAAFTQNDIYWYHFNGTLNAVADCNYSICDVTGKTIKTGNLRLGDNRIALDRLSNGLYLLKMVSYDGAAAYISLSNSKGQVYSN